MEKPCFKYLEQEIGQSQNTEFVVVHDSTLSAQSSPFSESKSVKDMILSPITDGIVRRKEIQRSKLRNV